MAALTGNTFIDEKMDPKLVEYRVVSGAHIYRGGAVGQRPDGKVRAFIPGDVFLGFAYKEANNVDGVDADNDVSGPGGGDTNVSGSTFSPSSLLRTKQNLVRVMVGDRTTDLRLPITSVATADIGRWVYAVTDNPTDIAFTGHPDAAIGRVLKKIGSSINIGGTSYNQALVRLKNPGESPPNGPKSGSIEVLSEFAEFSSLVDSAATLSGSIGPFQGRVVGAAAASDCKVLSQKGADGQIGILLGATSEAQNAGIETGCVCPLSGGLTAEFDFIPNPGSVDFSAYNAGTKMYFGLALVGTAPAGLTDTFRADPEVNTAGNRVALLTLLLSSASPYVIKAYSDDDNAPVADTDTTKTIAQNTSMNVKVIVRTTGVAEFWVNNAQVLTSTAFSVGNGTPTTSLFALFAIIRKAANTNVPEVRVDRARFGGSR